MSSEDLETEISNIVKIVESLPERYRDKCFEILLTNLTEQKVSTKEVPEVLIPPMAESQNFVIPIEVRALLRQFSVDDGKLFELFLITGADEIVPIYKIDATVASKGQIQIALLTALENTLKQTGKFVFSIEDVRQRCKDNKCYNDKNFLKNFSNSMKYFKESEPTENMSLSPYGKEKLIEIINAF
jgi:hypothetical protein